VKPAAIAAARQCVAALIVCSTFTFGATAMAQDSETQAGPFGGVARLTYPEPAPLIMNAGVRSTQSLNGAWNAIIDEVNIGEASFLGGGYYRNDRPKTGMELIEYSFDDGFQLNVPGDWNSQDPTLFRYHGVVWHQRDFDITPKPGKQYFLHFGAANYEAKVFVNGAPVGRHQGGYVSFNFNVTDHLVAGKNTVIARVNGHLDDSTIPTFRGSDFWKYGGITQDVSLLEVPETYIRQHHLYLRDREVGQVSGWAQLDGPDAAGQEVRLQISEAGVDQFAVTNNSGRVSFSFAANLDLWSPKSPKLYDVKISIPTDTATDRIGFRSIETDGAKILLNGEEIFLRGISLHEETVLREGVANNRADAQAQFALAKELNANFVRLSHYPHNEHTLRLADEMGLLVWSEVPVVSNIDWKNERTRALALAQVADNINRDLNRASIIIWSIGNETFPANQDRLDFLGAEAALARDLDRSDRLLSAALIGNVQQEFKEVGARLVTQLMTDEALDETDRAALAAVISNAASSAIGETSKPASKEIHVTLDDPLGEIVDIVGYNEYFGWYYSSFFARQMKISEAVIRKHMLTLMPDIRFRNVFGKPIIITEFGAGAKRGNRSDNALIWSEEYQAKVYERQTAMLSLSEQVQGMSPWILKDFRTAHRPLNGIQDFYNRKGLVDERGEKKLAFDVLRAFYASVTAD
jgi:beta-glucuronidase